MAQFDEQKHAEGTDLDEWSAHRFLEFFKETLTVQAMRDKLRYRINKSRKIFIGLLETTYIFVS